MNSPASRSDETLQKAQQSLGNIRYGQSLGSKSAALKRIHIWKKLRNAAFAAGAVLIGAGVLGAIIDGLGFNGLMLTSLIGVAAVAIMLRYPKMRTPTLDNLRQTDLATLAGKTEIWLESQRTALPAPAQPLLEGIGGRLDQLAPQLQSLSESEPAAREVRKLVGEHLPELINGYTRIPPSLRRQDNNGKTPEEQLLNGLRLIDQEIQSATEHIAKGELDKLAVRDRFLELKYDEEQAG